MSNDLDLAVLKKLSFSNVPTVLDALRIMDDNSTKLLMHLNGTTLLGMISIGDIQRFLLSGATVHSTCESIIRRKPIVASISDSNQAVYDLMLHHRAEYMPVVDANMQIHNILFWNEYFGKTKNYGTFALNIPVVIMAGGFGTRLAPLTNVLPKPLLPLGDKTILEYIMESFANFGCKNFYVTVNYKWELIQYYMSKYALDKYSVEYLLEATPLGTAGSLFLAKKHINSTFFVSNCDILIDTDLTLVYDYHVQSKNLVTIISSLQDFGIPYGTIETGENGRLVALQEKPDLIFQVNTGMYILEPQVLDYVNGDEFLHITDLIATVQKNGGNVGVFPVSKKSWTDIGEWVQYDRILGKYK